MEPYKVKFQHILPKPEAETSKACFTARYEDTVLNLDGVERTFSLYAIFDLSCEADFKTHIVSNLLNDVFLRVFEDNAAVSVPQALEKAVAECKNATLKVCTNAIFNCAALCFDAGSLYAAIFGDSKAYALENDDIVPLESAREGHFSLKTIELKGDEVLVLATKEFDESYPPQQLFSLSKPISEKDLGVLSGAVIFKVELDHEHHLLHHPKTSSQEPEITPSAIKAGEPLPKSALLLESAKKMKKPAGKKLFLIPIIVVVLALLGFIAFKVVTGSKKEPVNPQAQVKQPEEPQKTPKEEVKQVNGELQARLDEANKIKRVSQEVFYDISIADKNFVGNDLALSESYIAAADSGTGKIFVSALDVSKFEELPQIFPGASNLQFDGGTLIFTDNEGVKFYSLTSKSVTRAYPLNEAGRKLGPAREFSGFTYSFLNEDLIKYTKGATGLNGTTWATDPDFSKAVSLSIDGSIYILLSDGNILKYATGKKEEFLLVGLNSPLAKPVKIIADVGNDSLYVGDVSESRVVVLGKDGVLKQQLKPQDEGTWEKMSSFALSGDAKSLYVLSGSKVYSIPL